MSSDDKQNDWSQDPSLSGIDFARLQALQQMASQSRGKSQAEMMPFLLSLMQGNQGGAQFSASEADLIISSIKAGKSKQEAAKIDQMVRLFRSAASGKKRRKTTNQKTLPVWNPKPVSVFILCFFLPSSAWKARFYFLPGNQSEKQRSESVQPRSARYSARKVPECRRSEE